MKILQLCKKFPFPLRDGESIAVTYLSKALHEMGCEISLLAMNTTKHHVDINQVPNELSHYKEINWIELDNNVKPVDALLNLFSRESYHISRFCCKDFETELIRVLKVGDFDIVQLETLYLVPYVELIKKHSNAHVALRAHNVEHEIWERITNNTNLRIKKWYLSHLTKKLKRYELDHLNDYDLLIAITQRDLNNFRRMGYRNGAISSPIGIDTKNYKVVNTDLEKPMSLCFIGSLDWMPNSEGISWFLSEVWPSLHQRNKEIKLHIAGRNTPDQILAMRIPQIEIHGEVPDAIDFINEHPVMIVPLFSGSGMRVKILEGMALGKCVITTQLGLEGIDAKHKEHVLIANTDKEFIEIIEFCKSNPAELRKIGVRAKDYVSQYYDNKVIARDLYLTYKKYLLESPVSS